jgi:hypothetical protein
MKIYGQRYRVFTDYLYLYININDNNILKFYSYQIQSDYLISLRCLIKNYKFIYLFILLICIYHSFESIIF